MKEIVESAIKKDGKVYTARRHHNILSDAETVHGLGFGGLKDGEQGFVTNDGLFVDREVAAKIAYESGQIKDRVKRLHSEDLY